MMGVVRDAPEARRLALPRAHPELAGAAARARSLTAESESEQDSGGLDRMNTAYRAKFGFPFIIAVRGRGRAEEEAAVLAEIAAITRIRVERLATA